MRRTLPLLYIAFILVLVGLADTGEIGFLVRGIHAIPFGDKVFHALFALGLALATDQRFGRVVQVGAIKARSTHLWLPTIVLLEECSQHFVPGRTFDLGDLLADSIGLSLGFLISSLLRHRCAAPSPAATS